MKWHRPENGEERTLRWFAILPVWDDDNVYWLEWVTLYQTFCDFEGKFGKWNTYQITGDSDNGSEDNPRDDREGPEAG